LIGFIALIILGVVAWTIANRLGLGKPPGSARGEIQGPPSPAKEFPTPGGPRPPSSFSMLSLFELLGKLVIFLVGSMLAIAWPEYTVPGALTIAVFLRILQAFNISLRLPMPARHVAVTTRVVLLAMFGTLPLMVVPSHLVAIAVFLVYNLGVILLILMDLRLTPKPHQLVVRRDLPGKLSIAENNLVMVRLENHSFRTLEVSVIDEYPLEFQVDRPDFHFTLQKRSAATLRYQVRPPRRGQYCFGNVVVRYRGVLEMVIIQEDYPCAARVDVYPNIRNISRLDLSMRRSHLMETGLITERRRGSGTEFESLKEYVRGDEFRKIDWKATARRNKLISRNYQLEVNQSVVVAIDCSRPMGVRLGDITLLDVAVNAALLLGHQVIRQGDKIGLLAFADDVLSFLPPNRGKAHFNNFLAGLYNLQPRRAESDFQAAFTWLLRSRVRRSLLIILTDLAAGDAADRLRQDIRMVSRKHLPVIVSILDPVVRQAAARTVANRRQVAEKVVALDILERVRTAQKAVENLGVVALSLPPDEVNSALLGAYLKAKMRSRL
jgi:uncharacterized protein (DUF58 family)